MQEGAISIWDRIDLTQFTEKVTSENPKTEPRQDKQVTRSRRQYAKVDILAILFWCDITVKVFFGNPEVYLARQIIPSAVQFFAYPFVIYFVCALMIIVFFRKQSLLVLLYIAFFPLIALTWKLPRRIYKKQDWNLAIGVIHMLVASSYSLRYIISFFAFGGLAAILAGATNNIITLSFAIAFSMLLLMAGLYRSIRYALRPSKFITMQRDLIIELLNGALDANEEPKSSEHPTVEDLLHSDKALFTKEETDLILDRMWRSLVSYRIMYVWAYRIDEYRQSISAIVFSALGIIWTLIMMVYCTTIVNLSLFKLNHDEFTYAPKSHIPNLAQFIYYSFSSLYLNEINALTPLGTYAVIIKILAGFCGAILLLTVIVSIFLSYRQSKEDHVMRQSINEVKARGEELGKRFRSAFMVTPEEAVRRLQEIGYSMTGFIVFLTKQVPPGWS